GFSKQGCPLGSLYGLASANRRPHPYSCSRRAIIFYSCLCSALAPVWTRSAFGQEELRSSLAGEKVAEARKRDIENQLYNIKAGPVNLLFDAGLGIELNDNINL